jgi:O-6-methylguanine DNA methyltransferase
MTTSSAHPLRAGVVPTVAGPLAVLADEQGVVHAAGHTSIEALLRRMPVGTATSGPLPAPLLATLAAFDAGDVDALDGVPVEQPGTAFQQAVWAALRAVPPGSTLTYGALAAAVGRPAAARAVGQACGRNRVAPFVPCHRAVPGGGGVGGYAYGAAVKHALLEHERRAAEAVALGR